MSAGAVVRAALHVHSDWSYDGRWSLGAISRLGARLGLRAVLTTEHDDTFDAARFAAYRAACAAASHPDCRLVPGIEYSSPDNAIHILTWGLDAFLGARRPTAELLADVAAAGGVAVFAHPRRRDAWRRFDPAWAPLLSGLEVWNRKSDGLAPFARALDLAARHRLPRTVGVDFHGSKQLWPLHHRIPVTGDDPAADAVAAIRTGRSEPCAFGVALEDASGAWRSRGTAVFRAAEKTRRALVGRAKQRGAAGVKEEGYE